MVFNNFFTQNINNYDKIKGSKEQTEKEIAGGVFTNLVRIINKSENELVKIMSGQQRAHFISTLTTYLASNYRSFQVNGEQKDINLENLFKEYLKRLNVLYVENNNNLPTDKQIYKDIAKGLIVDLRTTIENEINIVNGKSI